MKRTFNDDYYCQTVETFETKTFSHRFWSAVGEWIWVPLVFTLLIGPYFAGSDWRKWLVVIFIGFIFLMLFLFMHEINENVRFVRHQLRAYRDAVADVRRILAMNENRDSRDLLDAIIVLDDKWENPIND